MISGDDCGVPVNDSGIYFHLSDLLAPIELGRVLQETISLNEATPACFAGEYQAARFFRIASK